ncbi:MAG: zinc-binding alcohol dehydrogenase [Candidatus Sumerlaeia bacterium]|nr:zinc-binding alcohol dehydrogenase [Candidatus Sumerlaeia bacterium]
MMNPKPQTRQAIYPDGHGSVTLVEETMGDLQDGFLRCRTLYSLVSPGTERTMIRRADGVSLDELKKQQFRLGYTAVGRVELSRVASVKPGDLVAVYGAPYVNHASHLDVPKNLAVPLDASHDPAEAAFVGLGAIALHGFRLAKVGLGDRVLVMGAGIIGNLCAQLARLAGCRVVVTDPVESRREILKDLLVPNGRHAVLSPDGLGKDARFDAVCICASNLGVKHFDEACSLVRRGARIVMLGDGKIELSRPLMFETEAEVIVSRAGGPGRYDQEYEAGGRDYPPQFVRWPEGENMREVISLLGDRLLVARPMISDVYKASEVRKAYEVLDSGMDALGILLDWDITTEGGVEK